MNIFNTANKRSFLYFNKFIKLFFLIFILILILYNIHKKNIFLHYIFNNEKDLNLFIRNKTLLYFLKRSKFLKRRKLPYNESKLLTFQDKINWLTIHESPEYKSNLVDKIKLHKYSKKILHKDICVPILKIYNNINDINLEELPNKFVLKLNHGSAMNILCNNKLLFNLTNAKKKINKWKNKNYGYISKEFQYMFVKRQIYAEQYLGDDLLDYKIFCFNGVPKFIRVRKMLFDKRHTKVHNHYDINWRLTDLESGLKGYFRKPDIIIKKPKNLNIMLEYARKLSKEFVFVRVDFYDINNTIYLGELTFTPSNSFIKWKNREQNILVGSYINLTKIKKKFYNN